MIELNSASISSFSSGIADINLKTLNILNNLSTSIDEFGPIGIIEIITIRLSKIFHPFLKKCSFLSSAKNLIQISITKKIVISVSKI